MEKYKITSMTIQPTMGAVDVCMIRADRLNNMARVPIEFKSKMRVGQTVMVHQNRRGAIMAYSFGPHMFCVVRPSLGTPHKRFMQGFRGLADGSLDRIMFKVMLMRAVMAMGHQPRWSAADNFKLLAMGQRSR